MFSWFCNFQTGASSFPQPGLGTSRHPASPRGLRRASQEPNSASVPPIGQSKTLLGAVPPIGQTKPQNNSKFPGFGRSWYSHSDWKCDVIHIMTSLTFASKVDGPFSWQKWKKYKYNCICPHSNCWDFSFSLHSLPLVFQNIPSVRWMLFFRLLQTQVKILNPVIVIVRCYSSCAIGVNVCLTNWTLFVIGWCEFDVTIVLASSNSVQWNSFSVPISRACPQCHADIHDLLFWTVIKTAKTLLFCQSVWFLDVIVPCFCCWDVVAVKFVSRLWFSFRLWRCTGNSK